MRSFPHSKFAVDEATFARRPLGADMLLPAAYGVVRLREVKRHERFWDTFRIAVGWLGTDPLGFVCCLHTHDEVAQYAERPRAYASHWPWYRSGWAS